MPCKLGNGLRMQRWRPVWAGCERTLDVRGLSVYSLLCRELHGCRCPAGRQQYRGAGGTHQRMSSADVTRCLGLSCAVCGVSLRLTRPACAARSRSAGRDRVRGWGRRFRSVTDRHHNDRLLMTTAKKSGITAPAGEANMCDQVHSPDKTASFPTSATSHCIK